MFVAFLFKSVTSLSSVDDTGGPGWRAFGGQHLNSLACGVVLTVPRVVGDDESDRDLGDMQSGSFSGC